jgi:hypothetical protein
MSKSTADCRLTWYQDRCRELLESLEAALAILGDDDLPDNGELSGAAVTDMMRAAVEKARQVAP